MEFTALWRRPLRAALVTGVAASTATALALAVSSPADSNRGDGGHKRGDRARNVIFLHGDGMGA
jgi:alkaline phosphatase